MKQCTCCRTLSLGRRSFLAGTAALAATGWKLTDILVTHHHGDHTAGIAELKRHHHCRVVAHSA